MSMRRNYCIDFLKLFFALCIALSHWGVDAWAGAIVYYFFIMSGFFLVQSFESEKYVDGFDYTKARISRIYPYYIIAWGILLLSKTAYKLFIGSGGVEYLIETISTCLPELFFVQNIGIYNTYINYPLWQLSTLIISSYIIYSLMCYDKKLTINVICPLIAILGCTYFSNAYETHVVEYWGVIANFISASLLRAFTGLCIGVSLYELIRKVAKWLEKKSAFFVSVIAAISIIYFSANNIMGNTFQGIISFIIVFSVCLCPKGILSFLFNRKIFKSCEKLSLAIYVSHAFVIWVVEVLVKNRMTWSSIAIFTVVLLIYSYIFARVVDYVIKRMKLRKIQSV